MEHSRSSFIAKSNIDTTSAVTSMVSRMQADIENRKAKLEASKIRKEQEEDHRLSQMFTPTINRSPAKTPRRASVYERMDHDVKRRERSLAHKMV
jgi:hypothetical protein